MRFRLTRESSNKKTGPIPVSTSSMQTCPPSCGLRDVCYAKGGPLWILWRAMESGAGVEWPEFLTSVENLPQGILWRHNQAGDLPGRGDVLDVDGLGALVAANRGKRGFTYTHKPLATDAEAAAVRDANRDGFTINLSADNLPHADRLAARDIGPVVVALPHDVQGNVPIYTPNGRRVSVCPATYRDDVTCATCGLCARADRRVIVGFPVHGARKRKYTAAV